MELEEMKKKLYNIEKDFIMYKKQMNILSGISNSNLIRIEQLLSSYGHMVTNRVMSDMLIRMRNEFEKEYKKEFEGVIKNE